MANVLETLALKRQQVLRLSNQSGASGEADAQILQENCIPRPTGAAMDNILAALKDNSIYIEPTSFDLLVVPHDVNLEEISDVKSNLNNMVFIEVKSSKQDRVKSDFSNFFFALTEKEISASEQLGERYKVLLYNSLNKETLLTSVSDILDRSKSNTWQLSVYLGPVKNKEHDL